MSTTAYWWNAAGLFLLLLWIIQRWRGGWSWFFVSAVIAGAVSLIPFFGHPPRYWLSGLTPNMSVPLVVLVALSVVQRAARIRLFRRCDWAAAWIFGATASLVLYPSALGLGLRNFDTYALGWPWLEWWPSLLLFGGVAAAAALLVGRGNRFGWILVAAAAACWLRLQESNNFWDYLLDPLYATVSLVAAVLLLVRRS